MKAFKKDLLNVRIYDSRQEMGEAAARDIEDAICQVTAKKGFCNVIFCRSTFPERSIGSAGCFQKGGLE